MVFNNGNIINELQVVYFFNRKQDELKIENFIKTRALVYHAYTLVKVVRASYEEN